VRMNYVAENKRGFWRHGMSSSAITADERVLDVAFSDDALSVSLRDGHDVDEDLSTEGLLRGAPAPKSRTLAK